MLRLVSWGVRPWLEFTLDPADGSYSTRRLSTAPKSYDGTAGFAQELTVAGRGTMLLAVYYHEGQIQLLTGNRTRDLFTPGLRVEHRRGAVYSQLRLWTPGADPEIYSYRRTNLLLAFIDSTGLRFILSAHARAVELDRPFAIIRASDAVHRVFVLTRLDERLPFEDAADPLPGVRDR